MFYMSQFTWDISKQSKTMMEFNGRYLKGVLKKVPL